MIHGDKANAVDTQWNKATLHAFKSEESELKFNQLTQIDEEAIGSGVKLLSQSDYSEALAPFYDFNDYSTEYSTRNTGPNLTAQKLATQPVHSMV